MPKLSSASSLRRRRTLRRLRLARRRIVRSRRGSALVLVLVMTFGMAALVLSGMFLAANASALGKSYDKEADFKYAAEGAIGMGKSRLNNDPLALPDTGFETLVNGGTIQSADGTPVRGLTYNLYVGPSGSTTGQHGRFASVVAEARDVHGARFVRRLELTQESFAKFAYWSNLENAANGSVIMFGGGDQLWGPVWSNDTITVSSSGGATFHDQVGTAAIITGKSNGTFTKGFKEREKRIELPTLARLSRLPGYAASGNMRFAAPNSGNETTVRMRIEFVALDLSQPADGDSTDADEGYLRIYEARAGDEKWLRADFADLYFARRTCGDFHNGKFYPVYAHHSLTPLSEGADVDGTPRSWFVADAYGSATNSTGLNHARRKFSTIMAGNGARCYPGGDPHLVYPERETLAYTLAEREKGGEDTTFTLVGKHGSWRTWGGTAYPQLAAMTTTSTASRRRSASEVSSMFPLFRAANANYKGLVHVDGTTAISGTLRGRVTINATGNVIVVDDMRYATDPAAAGARCADILGVISANNIVVSDNALLTPQSMNGNASATSFDDTKDFYLQGVLMALNTSFYVQNFTGPPTNSNICQATWAGRGCLYLTGGVIQNTRGAVGTSAGTGFVKRYSYDRCAAINPPPYFPTTGRFLDNRYYEIDPVRFDVASLFRSLTPTQTP